MRALIGVVLLAFVLGCSNPKNTKLPQDLGAMESIKPSLDKLAPQDKELLTGYILRHTLGSAFGAAFGKKGDPIPEGMTIGKAIEEQRAFVEKEKLREAEEKAKKDRIIAERKALSDQLSQILTIRLMGIKITSQDQWGFSKRLNLHFEMENKGEKTIVGLKGEGVLTDRFGDKVSETSMKIEETIPQGKVVKTSLGRSYNQFREEDKKLANVDAATCTFTFTPTVVLFSDGTKVEAPEIE